ncbi:hypothetical protein G9A89_016094 [Geosiphon pyriformis]|nr:hypothetical protein G9A89_016094 [Geosiphon pyriformis]
MEPSFNIGVKSAESRKKKRGGILEDNIGNRKFVAAKLSSGHSWGFKTGNTTESDSVDMEEECLVEETSFDHENGDAFTGKDLEQMSKRPLKKIDFLGDNVDDILLDKPVVLFPSLKSLVNVSVRKFFVLNISLGNVVGKSAQEKLVVVRKLFSKINGFGGASTPSKFAGIVRVTFTSELNLVQASKKAEEVKILVNSDLKKSSRCSDRAVVLKKILVETSTEAVCAVLSDFGVVVSIKIQLNAVRVARANHNKKSWNLRNQHRTLLYTLSIGTTAYDIWDYISSVNRKTCAIDCHLVTYAQARCAVVCFESADSLNAVMGTTPVLRGVNIYWSLLGFSKYAECRKLDHISLGCAVGGNPSSGKCSHRPLSDIDKSRLATIYAKYSVSIACPVAFGGVFWIKIAGGNVFFPLFMHEVLINSGFSSEMKPILPDTSNIEKRFAVLESSLASLMEQIGKLAKRLDLFMLAVSQPSPGCQLSVTPPSQNQVGDVVMEKVLGEATSGETATTLDSFASPEVKRLENILEGLFALVLSLTASLVWKIAMCNVRGMNNLVKQDNTKLRGKICLWIMNKFDGVWVFTFGLDSGHLDFGVAIIIDNSLVKHVCKNNLLVSILGLYAGALSVIQFFQASEINSLIAKTVNESSFVILGGNFNENRAQKYASLKKCFDLGLVDSLHGSLFVKTLMWSNSCGVTRALNYILVSSSLVNAVIDDSVANVEDYFDTDHKAVSASVGLGGLLDVYLSSIHKQANKDHWKFDIKSASEAKWSEFKDATVANTAMFLDEFETARKFSDLDAISWVSLDSNKASVVWDLVSSGASLDCVRSAFCGVKRFYHAFKLAESLRAEESGIRLAIERRMENFVVNKDHTICSVLEHPFHKVRQYLLLDYVNDNAFSDLMDAISLDDLMCVIKNLPDDLLLDLLNICLVCELIPHCWKEAWVLMIPKPYKWKSVLTNTRPIALIETARKILSKLLSDRISSACSLFNVLCGDNFFVLKGTTIQSLIFAISSVVKDALEKDFYDSVGWYHLHNSLVQIKMCGHFIRFFGSIYNNHVNQVMTDFGLTDRYWSEVFSSLLWRIFYNPLLCKVKSQESLCGYHIDTKFVAKTDKIENQSSLILFLAAGGFVDNTIWVGSSQAATQYIFDIASEFFKRVSSASLLNSSLPISIACKKEFHQYLGIYLLSEGVSKLSLAKVHSDVRFFVNLVLKKAISDKQFFYLVSAVLQPIISYRTQFSFISRNVCLKWNTLIRRGLRLKAGLSRDFLNEALHYSSLYGLKSFEQLQTEYKVASVLCFSNADGVFGRLLRISLVNNFLAGVIKIFLDFDMSFGNFTVSAFHFSSGTPISTFEIVFAEQLYTKKSLIFDWKNFHYWKRLNPKDSVPRWFTLNVDICSLGVASRLGQCLSSANMGVVNVYTDGSLKDLGLSKIKYGATVYFLDLDLSIGAKIGGLVFLTMVELQAIALALECVLSDTALDACITESALVSPDFRNHCWMERHGIINLIKKKWLDVSWHKVKGHLGIMGNKHVDELASLAVSSSLALLVLVKERFIMANKVGLGFNVIDDSLLGDMNWFCTALVTSTASLCSYFLKALHCHLPVAVRKCLYNKVYPSVLCLHCGEVESSDHFFVCIFDSNAHESIFRFYLAKWHCVLFLCTSDNMLYTIMSKDFVFKNWVQEALSTLGDVKVAGRFIVNFVRELGAAYHIDIWVVRAKYRALMEKGSLISLDGSVYSVTYGLLYMFSAGMIRLLGIAEAVGVCFGFCKHCCFFSGIGGMISVLIDS